MMDVNFMGAVYCTKVGTSLYHHSKKAPSSVFLPLRVTGVCPEEADILLQNLPCRDGWKLCELNFLIRACM